MVDPHRRAKRRTLRLPSGGSLAVSLGVLVAPLAPPPGASVVVDPEAARAPLAPWVLLAPLGSLLPWAVVLAWPAGIVDVAARCLRRCEVSVAWLLEAWGCGPGAPLGAAGVAQLVEAV